MYRLEVDLPQKKYQILIECGIIKNIGFEIKKIYGNKKIVIITDENIEEIYGDDLRNNLKSHGFEVYTIVVKPGEKSKSIETLTMLYDKLLDTRITRKDMIVAFGGGVVGDLAGFAAATLFRGIKYIQIPTSLLAQVDSSIGGKVAIDLPKGKNLVGSFYHPEAVFIDSNILRTLPRRFLNDGMAEVIKYACIKDKILFYQLCGLETEEDLDSKLEDIIYKCCSIKKEIVEKDEKEIGDRMLLNFGHTIGHGIERAFNYERFTHGESVAMGMYWITLKGEEMSITEKGTADLLKNLLIKNNLPYMLPQVDNGLMLGTINLDKKGEDNLLNIVLLNEIGNSFIKKINKKDMMLYI